MEKDTKVYVVVDTDTRRLADNMKILSEYGKVFDANGINEMIQIKESNQRIDIVFISSSTPMIRETIGKIKQIKAEIVIIGYLDPDVITDLFSLGVRDVLSHPINPTELGLHQKIRAMPDLRGESRKIDLNFGVSEMTRERIVLICSPKGGEGKTYVAVQCGAVLANVVGQTVLLDADYSGNAYRIAGKREMANSIAEFESEKSQQLDRDSLEGKLVIHESGLKILPSPWNVMTSVPASMMENALLAYRRFFSMMVIDTHAGYTPNVDLAAEYATDIIIVTLADEERLERLVEMLNRFMAKNIDPAKIRIIVNKATDKDIQDVRVAIKAMKLDITIHTLPYSPKEFAHKTELPVFQDAKKSPYSQSIRQVFRDMGIQSKKKAAGSSSPTDNKVQKVGSGSPFDMLKSMLKRGSKSQ